MNNFSKIKRLCNYSGLPLWKRGIKGDFINSTFFKSPPSPPFAKGGIIGLSSYKIINIRYHRFYTRTSQVKKTRLPLPFFEGPSNKGYGARYSDIYRTKGLLNLSSFQLRSTFLFLFFTMHLAERPDLWSGMKARNVIRELQSLVIPATPNAFGSRESFLKNDSGQAGMTRQTGMTEKRQLFDFMHRL